jgi:predicted nucleic-acid-binding Zn-ribbon protein
MDSCHNCGSTELYSAEVQGRATVELLPIGFNLIAPKLIIIVCGNCQFIHLFVHKDNIDKIKNKYGKFQRYYGDKESEHYSKDS